MGAGGFVETVSTPIYEEYPAQPGITATDDPELGAQDFEDDGFCSDDIYSQYLKKEYGAHPGDPESNGGTKRNRRAGHLNDAEVAALSYARRHLAGPTAAYYGAIPIVANERVDRWIQYYKTAGRREFMQWLVRGESVRRMVQPILEANGIPNEFFYLAMVESGFSNRAYSRKRATGTWQFMQSTAKLYGLEINHWVDERRDPVKSTIAASNYLKDLYDQLGDWHLAMAAYNAGPGKIRRAIKQGKSKDFWSLVRTPHLAKETKNYVPKVLAAVLLASDAHSHGFEVKDPPAEFSLPETQVVVKRPVQLEELAQQLGVPSRTLRAWNPELVHDITPPGRNGYALRVAPELVSRYNEIEPALSRIEVTDVKLHTVKQGDTIRSIARRYNIKVREIMSLNPQLQPSRLRIGHKVAVPVPAVLTLPVAQNSADSA